MDNIHCQLPVVCSSFKSTSAYCSLFWSLGLGVPVSLDGGWTIFIVNFLWSVLVLKVRVFTVVCFGV